ncbi:hypothetical protein TNIN_334401 [Trichonephila inaurata madagascariensis]|uniref:Uncharacterized protein n=1 Tax=Trichonephila inaurata madagascariensis TaxID=2747483 RepID=A0A8X7C5G1_9ARAC|nr:hypothetical protein TNIN_334401 [Trichonephila inaurata madagascariensis]
MVPVGSGKPWKPTTPPVPLFQTMFFPIEKIFLLSPKAPFPFQKTLFWVFFAESLVFKKPHYILVQIFGIFIGVTPFFAKKGHGEKENPMSGSPKSGPNQSHAPKDVYPTALKAP